MSAADWDRVVHGMIGVTQRAARRPCHRRARPYTFAGKTGTAQVLHRRRRTSATTPAPCDERLRDHSWFIAFAPADAPRIAMRGAAGERRLRAPAPRRPSRRKVLDAYLLTADGKVKPAT